MPSVSQVVTLLQTFGFPTAALVVVVWAFIFEKVVSGDYAKRLRAERDAALAALHTIGEQNERDLRDLRTRVESARRRS